MVEALVSIRTSTPKPNSGNNSVRSNVETTVTSKKIVLQPEVPYVITMAK